MVGCRRRPGAFERASGGARGVNQILTIGPLTVLFGGSMGPWEIRARPKAEAGGGRRCGGGREQGRARGEAGASAKRPSARGLRWCRGHPRVGGSMHLALVKSRVGGGPVVRVCQAIAPAGSVLIWGMGSEPRP